MATRKSKKQSARGKTPKRRGTRFGSVLFAMLFIVLIIVIASLFFKMEIIEVKGNSRYTAEEIVSKSGLNIGSNLFLFEKYSIVESIKSSMPYIDTVLIRRKLPSALEITVTERKEAAVLYTGTEYITVDEMLTALSTVTPSGEGIAFSGEDGSIPYIIGCTAVSPVNFGSDVALSDEDKRDTLKTILKAINSFDMTKNMREINVDKLYDIKLSYRKGYTITLGNSDNVDRKLKRVDPVIKVIGEDMGGIIDVSDSTIARYRTN